MTNEDREPDYDQVAEEDASAAESDAPGPSLASRGCGWIGCLLIIGVLIALAAGVYFAGNALEPLADKYLWAPHDVVRAYLNAYEDGNTERASKFVCADAPQRLPNPVAPLGNPSAWTAFVEDTFPYPRGGGQVAIYYGLRTALGSPTGQALLQREEDGWRVCEFTT